MSAALTRCNALIVDGYNIIHAWPALHATLRDRGLEDARRQLVSALAEYAAQTGVAVTVVFDAHARPGAIPPVETVDGVTVLFGSKRASGRPRHRAGRVPGDRSAARVPTSWSRPTIASSATSSARWGSRPWGRARWRPRSPGSPAASTAETRRMRDDSRRTTRVEDGLDPEIRRRLERIRRGEER